MSLKGKTLFITGGSRGIGLAIALKAAADGANVAIAAKTVEPHPKLEGTIYSAAADIEKAGGKALPLAVDVRDEASVKAGVSAAVDALGGLDVLVNAAGILRSSHTDQTTLDQFQQVIQVNLVGTFLMIRQAIPALLEGTDSAVLNFSSTSAMFAHPYMAAYAASKGGVQSMTHALAAEYAKRGIR